MSLKKDGEIKVYKNEVDDSPKVANVKESDRYTVDDLVKDSNVEETEDLNIEFNDVEKE